MQSSLIFVRNYQEGALEVRLPGHLNLISPSTGFTGESLGFSVPQLSCLLTINKNNHKGY